MSYSVLNDLAEAMKALDGKQDGVGEVPWGDLFKALMAQCDVTLLALTNGCSQRYVFFFPESGRLHSEVRSFWTPISRTDQQDLNHQNWVIGPTTVTELWRHAL